MQNSNFIRISLSHDIKLIRAGISDTLTNISEY